MFHMYQLACGLEFEDEVAQKVHNPRAFPASTLERLYQDNTVRKFLGIEFNDEGDVEGHIDAGEFKKGFRKLVKDVATEAVDSRSLDKAQDIQNYVAGISPSDRPDVTQNGSFTRQSLLSAQTQPAPAKSAAKAQPKRGHSPSTGIVPRDFPCTRSHARIRDMCSELQKLPVAKFPNATAVALRTLIEISAFQFLNQSGEIQKMRHEAAAAAAKKKQQIAPHWSPDLKPMLLRLANTPGLLPDPQVAKGLNAVVKDELFDMNLFIHNHSYHPSESQLRGLWAKIEELMKILVK